MAEFNYLREKARYLKWLAKSGGEMYYQEHKVCFGALCEFCLLGSYNNKHNITCEKLEIHHPDEATELIRKWAKEHPVKTRKDALLEVFPKANTECICFDYLFNGHKCSYSIDKNSNCNCEKCWNELYEVEE